MSDEFLVGMLCGCIIGFIVNHLFIALVSHGFAKIVSALDTAEENTRLKEQLAEREAVQS